MCWFFYINITKTVAFLLFCQYTKSKYLWSHFNLCNIFVTCLSRICHKFVTALPSSCHRLWCSPEQTALSPLFWSTFNVSLTDLFTASNILYIYFVQTGSQRNICVFRTSMVRLVEEFHFLWFVWPVTAISLLLSSSLVQTPITVASACIIVHWFSCALVFGSVVYSFGCILSYTLNGGDWMCGLFSLLASVLQNSKRNFYYVHYCSPHICNICLYEHSVGTCGLFSAAVRCRLLTDSPTLSFLAITLLY